MSPPTPPTPAASEHAGFLARQAADYPRVHRGRKNLVLHAVSNPVFLAGNLALLAAPLAALAGAAGAVAVALAVGGALSMVLAMAAQGAGHRSEAEPPLPFASPAELIARIFAEQWIAFPRYVLSGGFARAWREAR